MTSALPVFWIEGMKTVAWNTMSVTTMVRSSGSTDLTFGTSRQTRSKLSALTRRTQSSGTVCANFAKRPSTSRAVGARSADVTNVVGPAAT